MDSKHINKKGNGHLRSVTECFRLTWKPKNIYIKRRKKEDYKYKSRLVIIYNYIIKFIVIIIINAKSHNKAHTPSVIKYTK